MTTVVVDSIHGTIFAALLIALGTIVIVTASTAVISGLFSKPITGPLLALGRDVQVISGGDLSHQATVHGNDEIGGLARSFNSMASSLSGYIDNLTRVTAERERIGAELDVARHIQSSMLPNIFPAFPDRGEFDIHATMTPAREVGGDFYDFFTVDDSHLAIVIADVSGKGIPASLFMVIGKTLIKDHTTSGVDLGQVFTNVNSLLCEGNSQDMFITAFEGVLDLRTGQFRYVNAGHEPPFFARNGEPFAMERLPAGFVLAGMEGVRYRSGVTTLMPGDKLFQYTDGVTEATDAGHQLYGLDRLSQCLKASSELDPRGVIAAVKNDVDAFVGSEPQFDDITMLCLEYISPMTGSPQ